MSQAWTLSIVEPVARKAACPAHGDTSRRVHASSEWQGKTADGYWILELSVVSGRRGSDEFKIALV